ncbi:uncharacterized protein LOC18046493 [Citrus clementina]|nr:uncharacterized protein LOC18046493 [Citrus x clementina]
MFLSFLYSNRSHETQHPFYLLFSALIKRLAHKWEIMTLNSETPILETTDSRWLCGRISTNDFCIRPTNNPSVFEPQIRVDPQIQGQRSLLRSFTYIGMSLGKGLICLFLFEIWTKILHRDFPDRSFRKSSSKYLSSDSWIYIKQVHAVYVTHCIMIIFLLLIAIVVRDEVGENLLRVYRGSKSQLPFILHLAEL